MKIQSVQIQNFRSFKNETVIFNDYTCFVGANGAGKSTILNALNVFFRQYKDSKTDLSKLTKDDFHHKDTDEDIRITVTFSDLSKQAKEDLSHYVRQDKLIVSAVAKYDTNTGIAEVKQYGQRLVMKDFARFFEADKEKAKVKELQEIYSDLKKQHPDLKDASTKGDMISSLQEFESARPEKCTLEQSSDDFYGATKGANKLAPHVQWIFVSAVKDVTAEAEETKSSALGQLLARTVRSKVSFVDRVSELRDETRERYQQLLDTEQTVLKDISKSLQDRLSAWAHPNITAQVLWKQDPEKSIRIEEPLAYIKLGENDFDGDLSRFGHGLQRSYMLALLQELALVDDANAPTLIMGIEEPEIYQHPPQARYLAETLFNLTEKGSQLLLCTHSPLFIPGDNFDKIRIVRESGDPSYTTVKSLSYEALSKELNNAGETLLKESGMVAKLYPSLNPVTNEMFFCKVLILTEGLEDIAFITSYLIFTGKIENFRRYGCHIVPVDGKSSLIKPLAMAKLLSIPAFVVFDADTDKQNIADEKKRNSEVAKHKKDNKAILELQGHGAENEWPSNHIIKPNLTCWKANIGVTINEEIGADWKKYEDKAATDYANPGGLGKNPLAIAKALEYAWNDKIISQQLIDLTDRIIAFAKTATVL
jgi:putative ATP-dependent endonuclease of the OLD family